MADQLLLVRQAQPARGGTAGDDQCLGVNNVVSQMQCERPLAQVRAGQVRHAILRAKTFGLLAHVFDELWPHDSVGKSRKVLDERGHGKLATRLVSFNDERLEIGARGVESSRVSGASGADDDYVSSFAHECFSYVDWMAKFRFRCKLPLSVEIPTALLFLFSGGFSHFGIRRGFGF